MHGHFSSEFNSTPSIPGNAARGRWYLYMLEPLIYGKNIPDEVVWDIFSRRHGMRLLFTLYLDKTIEKSYVNSNFSIYVWRKKTGYNGGIG